MTVAATDTQDERLGFSNWGPSVDVAAPGVDVLSLRARFSDFAQVAAIPDYAAGEWIVGADGQNSRASGTSFAAPLVSGDRLLLCSDGLTTCLGDQQISGWIERSATPDALCMALMTAALEAGAPDNVSVIAVFAAGG